MLGLGLNTERVATTGIAGSGQAGEHGLQDESHRSTGGSPGIASLLLP